MLFRMMLFKNDAPDPKLVACHVQNNATNTTMNYDMYMFAYQHDIQMALVVIAVMMIPVMLFGKPLTIWFNRRKRRQNYAAINDEAENEDSVATDSSGDEHEEEGFGDILIIQGSSIKVTLSITLCLYWQVSTPSSTCWAPSPTPPATSACGRSPSPTTSSATCSGPWCSGQPPLVDSRSRDLGSHL